MGIGFWVPREPYVRNSHFTTSLEASYHIFHMSCSLNSFRGAGYIGDYTGDYYKAS